MPREQELSEQFSVSRQAVREALKVLAAKGLVTSRRRAGTHVLPRSSWNLLDPDVIAWHPVQNLAPDFLADLVELRRLIEPAAAEMAAMRSDPEQVAAIAEAIETMRRSEDDHEAFYVADVAFHRAMFAASGNSLIDRMSTILLPLLDRTIRAQGALEPSFEEAVNSHVAIFDAIRVGDASRAREAMNELLDIARTEVETLAEQRRAAP